MTSIKIMRKRLPGRTSRQVSTVPTAENKGTETEYRYRTADVEIDSEDVSFDLLGHSCESFHLINPLKSFDLIEPLKIWINSPFVFKRSRILNVRGWIQSDRF